jgi:hypothetical protein
MKTTGALGKILDAIKAHETPLVVENSPPLLPS